MIFIPPSPKTIQLTITRFDHQVLAFDYTQKTLVQDQNLALKKTHTCKIEGAAVQRRAMQAIIKKFINEYIPGQHIPDNVVVEQQLEEETGKSDSSDNIEF